MTLLCCSVLLRFYPAALPSCVVLLLAIRGLLLVWRSFVPLLSFVLGVADVSLYFVACCLYDAAVFLYFPAYYSYEDMVAS